MKVLIACEHSGTIRSAFRSFGHDAWSIDLKPDDFNSKYHIQDDIITSGVFTESWDLMIAHPPCTHLAVSGARWFKDKVHEQKNAIEFARYLFNAPVSMICLENPVSILSTAIRKPDQIVHPWMFGDPFTKRTCLWLKNLPLLKPTNIVSKGEFVIHANGKRMPAWYNLGQSKARSTIRSKTFEGMAQAMALQWSMHVMSE